MDDIPQDPPSWPVVFGWISAGWGTVFLLCGMYFLASPLMLQGAQGMGELPPTMKVDDAMLLQIVLSSLCNIILIVGGVLLVLRKPAGKTLHLVYAVLATVVGTWGMYRQFELQDQIKQWVIDNPNSLFAKGMSGPGAAAGATVGLVVGLLITYIYPVTCFIWFGVVKAKAPLR
jgi:hypothetical protein